MSATSSTDPGGAARSWIAIRVVVPADAADDVAGWVGAGGLGVQLEPRSDGTSELACFVERDEDAAAVRGRLQSALRAVAGPGPTAPIRIERVRDGRWVEAYQAGLRPLSLGRRFVVVPGIDPGELPAGRERIDLAPGRAFGTGEHPTTRLCAAALEQWVRPGERWLDLGTGTGVLAWVASRCGAGRVRAIDLDREAVEVAREVVAVNGGDPTIDVRRGTASGEPDDRYDGVVANISESYFLLESTQLARILRPDGVLIASGFLEDDAAAVERALADAGLRVEARAGESPWGSCVARKRSRRR